jgi:hypothetical protein
VNVVLVLIGKGDDGREMRGDAALPAEADDLLVLSGIIVVLVRRVQSVTPAERLHADESHS